MMMTDPRIFLAAIIFGIFGLGYVLGVNSNALYGVVSIDSLEKLISLSISDIKKRYPENHSETEILGPEGNVILVKQFSVSGVPFSIIANEGVAQSVIIENPGLATEKGIRVGDSLKKIMQSYDDARFYSDFNLHELIVVHVKEGLIKFTFDTRSLDLEEMILSGKGILMDSDNVADIPIHRIYISNEK